MFTYAITELEFSGGETILLKDVDVLILVGANNCGKSQAIRDIAGHLHLSLKEQHLRRSAVKQINVQYTGTQYEFLQWLEQNYPIDENEMFLIPDSWSDQPSTPRKFRKSDLEYNFKNDGAWPNSLRSVLVRELNTSSRLTLGKPASRIDVYNAPPKSEIHILQKDDARLRLISSEVRAAFGMDLIINWGSGSSIALHVGNEPERTLSQDRVSPEYLKQLNKIPRLERQGDGIRCFVGCLLAVKCGHHKILLIDEPEAFLHPPQAKRLGRLIAESAQENGQQIILATHSSDLIQGVISSSANVAICRINRVEDINHAYLLGGNDLAELWSKPLLKSSGAIQGLFHRGVVVCESDADCRFYESIVIRSEKKGKLAQPADLYFVHGGGKGELATLARDYLKLHVPVAVVADFDILKIRGEFQKLIEALGGDFGPIESLYNSVTSDLNNLNPVRSLAEALTQIRAHLEKIEIRGQISSSDKQQLVELLEDARDWSEAKKYGIKKLSGGAYRNCVQLLEQTAVLGLFIVPGGEMEGWDKSLSAQKDRWIQEALEKIDSDMSSFIDAEDFVHKFVAYLDTKVTS